MYPRILIFIFFITIFSTDALATSRYFYGGDGTIDIVSAESGAAFKGRDKNAEGDYIDQAMRKIDRAFGAKSGAIEPRFIEFLDYLQDELKGGRISIISGYRSPSYNQSLRDNGRLAGKASIHQYGMAADIRMQGVLPEKIWYFVRELGYGGVGYYHGANAHVDVGPARFWDETSSKVHTDHADDNKLITLVPHQDIYQQGEELKLRFIRMTAYPIGINPIFTLEREKNGKWKKAGRLKPQFAIPADTNCPKFSNIDQLNNIRSSLPTKIKPGRYRVRTSFCNNEWEAMPDSIVSYVFEVR